MIRFIFEIDGEEQFDRAFNRLDHISDLRSIWGDVADEFYKIEAEQFASEGSAGASGKWAPLSALYAKSKIVKFPGKTILRRTDSLFASLTGKEAPGAIFRPMESELQLGSSVPYGIYHQRGTSRMPARKPISMSEDQKRRMQKAIQKGLVQFIRRQGFNVLENAA